MYSFRLWVIYILILGELCLLVIGSCGCNEWPGWDLKCKCNGCEKKYALVQRIWSDRRAVSECQEAVRTMDSTLVGKSNEGEYLVDIVKQEDSHSHAMPMSFMATTNTVILWDWWRVSTTLPYLLSCLACTIMAFISIAIKIYTQVFIAWIQVKYTLKDNHNTKNIIQPNTPQTTTASITLPILNQNTHAKDKHAKNTKDTQIELKTLFYDEKSKNKSSDDQITQQNSNISASTPKYIILLKIAIQSIVYTIDYLVMLIVMTYNVGLFFSCILGISLGTIVFAPSVLATPSNHLTPACCSL